MTDHTYEIPKEARVLKRTLFVALVVVAIVAFAVPAFASGYNDPLQYTRATGYFAGPHGGYTTTTNKCADCHAVHYAAGSFMLMRANSREAACDYCHGGGGGSTINIQMDNDYRTGSYDMAQSSAITTTTMGYGTGHTLGYQGEAPADINPAYSSAAGFACFDCHTPHGNSARVMTTFGNPGRAFAAPGQQGRPTTAQLNGAAPTAFWPIQPNFGNGDKDGLLENGEWGVDYQYGNFVWDGDSSASFSLRYRPIWPSGRFLLKKDPHSTAAEGQADTVVTVPGQVAGDTGFEGYNKFAIDWNEPLGPADGTYGGFQDNDNDNNFPFAPKQTVDTDGNGQLDGGFLAESEFCTDCHDGTAGASTQAAVVYQPGVGDVTAYSHDAQPRH